MAGLTRFDYGQIELDNFEDEVYAMEYDGWSDDIWDDVFGEERSDNYIGISPRFLNNQDYTLNSPLIVDSVNAFKSFLISGRKDKLHYSRGWEGIKGALSTLNKDWTNLQKTEAYHKECSKLWLDLDIPKEEIMKLVIQTDTDSRETHKVVNAYFKSWTGQDIKFMSRTTNSPLTWSYGALMLETLRISWIMNASTEYELEELKKSLGFSYLLKDHKRFGVIYKSKIFGKIAISGGFMYLEKMNMIWDRNMLLMFKDTSTARFHTLFAIQHRPYDRYARDHLPTIEKLYKTGDKVLAHDAESAYDVFGVIEPLSSLMLSEMAGECRPLIPSFPHFRNHINQKMEELKRINGKSKDFFSIILGIKDKRSLLTVYGSFRHWGHPFISYFDGLAALYKNVQSTAMPVDTEYANLLASDLTFKILKKEFRMKYKWFIDSTKLPDGHPLKDHVQNNTWPSADVLLNYPDSWNDLPLLPCWDIPEVVDPAIIYSDKTHSIQKKELISHLVSHPGERIPTLKVLNTLIRRPATNWPQFLRMIDQFGLSEDDLVIGLKAKEREIKKKGRFFALMSWALREYFVFTEYLIKKNVIPLFKGLTMADDQTTLIRKMLDNTAGQGGSTYEHVTIANHIDYEKWNNFQRYEATEPVFTVIGKFFGLPNLFARTHEFFSKSLVYYRDRPDLMRVVNGQVENVDPIHRRVCWNGQKGGLEGLRQKGWSVLNLLVIEREGKIRNTSIKILAQGDNQVICCEYTVHPYTDVDDLVEELNRIMRNNEVIINRIREATASIGLRINEDETLQAADMLIYGKSIVYRGNFTCLEEKRFSRITCTTNDQLPSLSNILSTVSTNCLTVAHYSKSPKNAMIHYNWLGNLVLNILGLHNPALRCAPKTLTGHMVGWDSYQNRILTLYLDPSLGGVSGMSLTRFHVRMFPDPVTEALVFWKMTYDGTMDSVLRTLAATVGNPKLSIYNLKSLNRLIEDPSSLNIPRGISAQNLIKEEIKRAMLKRPDQIQNEIVRDAVLYTKANESYFLAYLSSINPLFPRFLSEFKSSTYFGLTAGILGLFENSKTIRNLFKHKFRDLVDAAIVRCELNSLQSLVRKSQIKNKLMWTCSASQSDKLRSQSWGREVVGTTVPHPAEMIGYVSLSPIDCSGCKKDSPRNTHLIVLVPLGMACPEDVRGPYAPYLGSSTSENTSLVQSWEKDTDISFIRRASEMRRAYNWLTLPTSNVGRTIENNLNKMTGENSGGIITGFKRTGSPLHRFSCSRVSPGGYSASNSVYGSRMIISTDNFHHLGEDNFDFMYQPTMLYAQQTVGELHQELSTSRTYHFHISCVQCLRKIEEPLLDSPGIFEFPDVSQTLTKWKPTEGPWFKESNNLEIPVGDWDKVNHADRSRQIGIAQGIMFGLLHHSYYDTFVLKGLFPIALRNKVQGASYLLGLKDGIYRAAVVEASHRRIFYKFDSIELVIRSCYTTIIQELIKYPDFITFIHGDAITFMLRLTHHRIPPSYPLNNHDLGAMAKSSLLSYGYLNWKQNTLTNLPTLWIFADFVSVQLSGMMIISYELINSLNRDHITVFREKARELSQLMASLRSQEPSSGIQNIIGLNSNIRMCQSEIRHSVKSAKYIDLIPKFKMNEPVFSNRVEASVHEYPVEYILANVSPPEIVVPRIQNPLISGIRIPQISTGSFIKVEALLNELRLSPEDIICGGDGSGGISASLLRRYPASRLIFNSLLNLDGVQLGGSLPSPPSALDYMPDRVKNRCVNLKNAWELPSDLSKEETWIGFRKLKLQHGLQINLIVLDMEIQSDDMTSKIEACLRRHLKGLLMDGGTLILKTYIHRLFSTKSPLITLGSLFNIVTVTQNDFSSSHTSEVYVVFQKLRVQEIFGLHPHWESLNRLRRNAFCFQNYESEFHRARTMMLQDLTVGIPGQYMPDPHQELVNLWVGIGGDRVVLMKMQQMMQGCKISISRFAIMTSYILSVQVINTTRWEKGTSLTLPSDGELSKLFGYYVGVLLHFALTNDRIDVAIFAQRLIDKPFFIFFYQRSPTGKLLRKNPSSKLTAWSFEERAGYVRYKKVFLQSNLALIGATLRHLLSISKDQGQAHLASWMERAKELNKSCSLKHAEDQTGILYPFDGRY